MKHQDKQYDIASLSHEELEQVSSLEATISKEKEEGVVLIAYKGNEQ